LASGQSLRVNVRRETPAAPPISSSPIPE
jgi:hypothetical protein